MAATKDSTTLERRMGMTDFTTLENGGDTKNPAAEASAAKAAKTTTDMQSRTPSPACIRAPLVGTTMAAPPATTRIVVTRACTVGAFTKVVFTQAASAAAVD